MKVTNKNGKSYCGECGQRLPEYAWTAGQCRCGRFAWWCDDGGNNGVERPKKKDRVASGRMLEKMVRPWA